MNDLAPVIASALEHHRAGRLDEAETIYRKILEIDSHCGDALNLLGMVTHARGDHDRAIALVGRAILVDPRNADYHANLAAVYLSSGNAGDAIAHGRRAVGCDDAHFEAYYNLGNALFAAGDVEAAIPALSKARDLAPDNQYAQTNYLFAINFSPLFDREKISAENKKWGQAVEGTVVSAPTFDLDRNPDRKLKIGYYLPEPGDHLTPRFLEPLLAGHDRDAFEIALYFDHAGNGRAVDRLAGLVDRLVDLTGQTDAEQAASIRADGIDILNHPAAFKARYRTILAHRAAPIQMASTNLISTTGLSDTDYLITDETIDPPGIEADYYTESLIRLSHFNCYARPRDCPDVVSLPQLSAGHVTFGSFNNVAKMSVDCIAAEILNRVPDAELFLKHRAYDDLHIRARISDGFDAHGIDPGRIRYSGFTAGQREYLASYGEVDIGLDPFPFNGGTTSYESLWMGVPVVTLSGGGFMSGLAAGMMTQAGVPEFVADTVPGYVETAVAFADRPARMVEIRRGLREAAAETVFNETRYVSELEGAYRDCWRRYCAGPVYLNCCSERFSAFGTAACSGTALGTRVGPMRPTNGSLMAGSSGSRPKVSPRILNSTPSSAPAMKPNRPIREN